MCILLMIAQPILHRFVTNMSEIPKHVVAESPYFKRGFRAAQSNLKLEKINFNLLVELPYLTDEEISHPIICAQIDARVVLKSKMSYAYGFPVQGYYIELAGISKGQAPTVTVDGKSVPLFDLPGEASVEDYYIESSEIEKRRTAAGSATPIKEIYSENCSRFIPGDNVSKWVNASPAPIWEMETARPTPN